AAKDYARNAKVVMVDLDQAELDKGTHRIDLKVRADALVFLTSLQAWISSAKIKFPKWDRWQNLCQDWRKRYPVVTDALKTQNKPGVNSYLFVDALSDTMPSDGIVLTDMGFAFQNVHQAFRNQANQRMITNCGLASMGWGLPAAIGASVASPGRTVVCVSGEGGFMMTSHELATLMHHQLPVKLFIFNNGGYLTIKQTQQFGFEGRLMGCNQESGISFPDFKKLAEAHHFDFVRMEDNRHLASDLKKVLASKGPSLVEVMQEVDQPQAPMAINRRNPDGSIRSATFEDLYPYLDSKEIEANLKQALDL
ncbi:MAG: thiamine pyrophosphate-dependent enzyme, partial [Bdellovibrionota bacterium]